MHQLLKRKDEIEAWLGRHVVGKYTEKYILLPDARYGFVVDVEGDISLSYLNFIAVKFGHVSGSFRCTGNNLTSLKGSPDSVGAHFFCNQNRLTTLKYSPKEIPGIFNCSNNRLVHLKGAPKKAEHFFCSYNDIESLCGTPIAKTIDCSHNKRLGAMQELTKYEEVQIAMERERLQVLGETLGTGASYKSFKI